MNLQDIHPNIKLRLVMQFLSGLVSMAIIPFLAIYFAQKIGTTETGIVLILIVISGVIGGFIGGYLSDRTGRRKIMIYSELGVFISYLFIAICNSPWFNFPYVSIGFFCINVFCGGMLQPAAQAMIIDVTDSKSRKLVFTINYWLGNVSTAIGGMIGAFLFINYLFELFIGISIISLLSVLMTVFFITETYIVQPLPNPSNKKVTQSPLKIVQSYGPVFKDKLFMFYIIGAILIFSLEQSLSNYVGIRLEKDIHQHSVSWLKFDFMLDGTRMLGFLRTENTILVVMLSTFVLFIVKKWRDRWTLVSGMFIFSICFSAFAFTNDILFLFILMFIGTIGELMYVPIKQAMIGDLAPANARSTYMALSSLSVYGAIIVASMLILVGEWISPIYMAVVFLSLGTMGTFLYYLIARELDIKVSEKDKMKAPMST